MSAAFIPFYLDDFDGDTSHLTPAEEGVYMRLLKMAWRTPRCELPNDLPLIARKCRVSVEQMEPVLREYFKLQRGRWVQSRLKKEYDKLANKKRERSQAGKKGGLNRALKNKENISSIATDLLKQPEPEPEPIKKEQKRSSYPDDFLSVWKAFPHTSGRSAQGKSYDQWRLLPDDERSSLPEAIAKLVISTKPDDVKFIPAMERWLRDGKHRHFLNDKQPEEQITDERWLWRISKGKENGWRAEWGDPPDSANTNCPPHLRKEWKQSISD